MKKLVLPLNIIFLGLSLACDTALIITHLYPIKITASVFFMLAAAVNLIYALKYFPDNKLPSVILTVGVFFAMSADIAINLNFIAGAAIFALGHICYFIAYSLMQKPRPTDFIPAIIIFIPIVLFMMFSPLLDFGSVMMKIIGISYAVIICIMTGKAIMNFIRIKNRFNLILALGSVLFLISDIMLLMAYFSKIDFPFSNFCLALYYPGQCLIANGLAHIKTAITEKNPCRLTRIFIMVVLNSVSAFISLNGVRFFGLCSYLPALRLLHPALSTQIIILICPRLCLPALQNVQGLPSRLYTFLRRHFQSV